MMTFLAALPETIPRIEHAGAAPFSLAPAALHELYAASGADGAGLTGGALAMAHDPRGGAFLWVRQAFLDQEGGAPCPQGLSELGLDVSRLILLRARDTAAALQAGLEGARCQALGAVIIELWGAAKAYDLTASRRLALAARASGTRVILTRVGAEPQPSAAETRWRVRAAPSCALDARAPGKPALELTLLRARNAQEGLRYHLEWDRDARCFACHVSAESASASHARTLDSTAGGTPLSGVVVPVSFDGQGSFNGPAEEQPRIFRRAG